MKNKLPIITLAAMAISATAGAQIITENFDNVGSLFGGGGWAQQNLSNPVGPSGASPWVQGDGTTFPSAAGAANSYITANYETTGDNGTISAWLITPTRTFYNGDVVRFLTRTASNSLFADRMQVRLSTAGSSVNVGSDESSVGDFTGLLGDINPNLNFGGYPTDWTSFSYTISGLSSPSSGRVGFRYYVTDAGALGNNSNIVGIDSFQAVPEPATLATLALGGFALLRRSRKSA